MNKLWLVVVGAMLVAGLPAYAAKPGAEKQPTKVEVVGEVKIAEPPAKPDPAVVPCPPDKDIRTSDLCAQWKAADAATASARWSIIGGILSIIGGGTGVVALILNLNGLKYAEQQTRAWISSQVNMGDILSYKEVEPGRGFLNTQVYCDITNVGVAPATNVRFYARLLALEPGDESLEDQMRKFTREMSQLYEIGRVTNNVESDGGGAVFRDHPMNLRRTVSIDTRDLWSIANKFQNIEMVLVGCVLYRTGLVKATRHTSFVIEAFPPVGLVTDWLDEDEWRSHELVLEHPGAFEIA